jgi:hypothetical protein
MYAADDQTARISAHCGRDRPYQDGKIKLLDMTIKASELMTTCFHPILLLHLTELCRT